MAVHGPTIPPIGVNGEANKPNNPSPARYPFRRRLLGPLSLGSPPCRACPFLPCPVLPSASQSLLLYCFAVRTLIYPLEQDNMVHYHPDGTRIQYLLLLYSGMQYASAFSLQRRRPIDGGDEPVICHHHHMSYGTECMVLHLRSFFSLFGGGTLGADFLLFPTLSAISRAVLRPTWFSFMYIHSCSPLLCL